MIARTDDFKNEIKLLGKQIDFRIGLHINDRLITENNKYIMTEDNNHLVVEQFNEEDVDEILSGESVYNVAVVRKGNILSTMMKEVDFEIEEDLKVGDLIDASFGLKVGEDYEWINYGRYIIYSKEHNEDTNTYSYVSYDSMMLSMIMVDDRTIIENVTLKKAIENICDKVGLTTNITNTDVAHLPNLTKTIHANAFKDVEMTYRDVLDMICQALGVSMITDGKELKLKYINNEIVDEFDEEYLKDTNVTFGELYGPINSVVLSRSEDNDNIYRKDDESIASNGLHEFKIKDNLIMLYDDREDYIDEIYSQLNGLEYYVNDFRSTGITYLEWLDYYNITVKEKEYKCLLLNDEIKLRQGLEENIYTEQPYEATTDYKISAKSDKEVSFIVDKQNGKISSRVTQDEMESYVEQTAEGINTEVSKKVGKSEVISSINQTAETIKINASRVNLTGLVTISDLEVAGMTTINGSNITTGSINANLITTGSIKSSNYVANTSGTKINLTNGTIDTKNFKVDASGNTTIKGGNIAVNGYDLSHPYLTIGRPDLNYPNGPYGVYLSERGVVAENSSTSPAFTPIITTETDDGFAKLEGINISCVGTVTSVRGVCQGSLEKMKKNFEKFESGLDILKDIDIYKYNYKKENDDDKKHIGLVIGKNYKYREEVTNKENNSVDLYSFIGVCCKAIQEQQEQINELKEQIKSLKEDK